MIRGIVVGFILAVIILGGGVYYYFAAGVAPVATADAPMPFERKLAGMALDAHIDKQKVGESPVAADEAAFLAGAKIYQAQCAVCHGTPDQSPAVFAAAMFPKPPLLFKGKGVTDDPPSESYWKVANGIRLSGMPAFKSQLSDMQMWQVSLLVAHANEISNSVKKAFLTPTNP